MNRPDNRRISCATCSHDFIYQRNGYGYGCASKLTGLTIVSGFGSKYQKSLITITDVIRMQLDLKEGLICDQCLSHAIKHGAKEEQRNGI